MKSAARASFQGSSVFDNRVCRWFFRPGRSSGALGSWSPVSGGGLGLLVFVLPPLFPGGAAEGLMGLWGPELRVRCAGFRAGHCPHTADLSPQHAVTQLGCEEVGRVGFLGGRGSWPQQTVDQHPPRKPGFRATRVEQLPWASSYTGGCSLRVSLPFIKHTHVWESRFLHDFILIEQNRGRNKSDFYFSALGLKTSLTNPTLFFLRKYLLLEG